MASRGIPADPFGGSARPAPVCTLVLGSSSGYNSSETRFLCQQVSQSTKIYVASEEVKAMSKKSSDDRSELLAALGQEFRQFATATVLFHQAIADRLGMHVTDHRCAEILLRTGPITAGELAQRTGLTTGAITGVIDRLEKAGFVRRAKDPGDRRRVVIEPFPERIEREIAPLFESIGRAMADLCAQYSTRELAVIRDFIARVHQARLRARSGSCGRRTGKQSRPRTQGRLNRRDREPRISREEPKVKWLKLESDSTVLGE